MKHQQLHLKTIVASLSVGMLVLTSLPTIAHAASGFGTFSVSPGSGVMVLDAVTELKISVNAEDASLFSANTDVVLTNAALDSYDCSKSDFTSLATLVNGGVRGSSTFTVVASLQADNQAKPNTDMTLCTVRIRPLGEGTVTVVLGGTQAYEAADESPILVPTIPATATFTAQLTPVGSSDGSQPTLSTTAEGATNTSIVPSTTKNPKIVTDAELIEIKNAPALQERYTSTKNLVIIGVTCLIVGTLFGVMINRYRTHKKFIRVHGMDSYKRHFK